MLTLNQFQRLDAGQPINWSNPLMRGLVGRWQVAPGGHPSYKGGPMLREFRHRYDGTLTSDPTWEGALGRPGGFGSMGFALASSQTVIVNGLSWSAGPITVSFWIKTAGGEVSSSWGFGDVAATNDRIHSHTPYSDNVLYWDFGDYATGGRVSTDFSSFLNKWTHVVLVATGSSGAYQAIYFNGKLANSAANSSQPTVTRSTLRIGSGYSNALNYSTNKQDAFMVWNRVLSASEVKQLYDATRRPDDPTLNWLPIGFVNSAAAATTRGMPFETRSTAFNGGRCLAGVIR